MIALTDDLRGILKQLYSDKEEVCINAFFEGTMGQAWIDRLENPTIGLVAVADYCFLLGKAPMAFTEAYMALLELYGTNQIILFFEGDWKTVLQHHFGERVVQFTRYAFHWTEEGFNRKQLEQLANQVHEGFELVPMNTTLCEKALTDNFTADFCMFFESPKVFLEKGLGYMMIDTNNDIVAGASSYSVCKDAIDITIGTVPEYRRRGMAQTCAAKLILDCLDKGIYPKWDAANINSVALAEKLGYKYKGEYDAFTIKRRE